MRRDVIVTCAVTGAGDTAGKSDRVPVTPKQIAEACIEAAQAGAAIAHAHVRNPETGAPVRDPALFREVVERVRESGTDVVLNLTSGMGGDLIVDDDDPARPGAGSDLVNASVRLEHVEALLPEICTLDCGSMNFGDANTVLIQTPNILRAMAKRVRELGVKPELEVFDTGHLWFAKTLYEEGLLDDPPLFQLCMGIPYGTPGDPASMMHMASQLPANAQWAGFGIGRNEMPMVAQAVLLGGHVRVGLEDNLYLDKGVLATNGQLVEKAVKIVELLGARTLAPQEARELLKLRGATGK